jgi:hypothetical protein
VRDWHIATHSAHRQKWQKNLLKQEQEKPQNFQLEKLIDVGNAEEGMDICEHLIFAEFVLES